MSEKTAYRGSIFCFKDTATLANLPINKDLESGSNHQYNKAERGGR